ncbi:hypothetical protein FWF74_03580 [Candidatus Saccharibacteria bacterium]|nr:hypothetical protein [Candidatus Saccharibacteria bacterium]MCL1962854.1 hypothetical protein [Candidatus Saccharibacteria bacterium]
MTEANKTHEASDAKAKTKEIEEGKAMAILSYIGILALISYFAGDKKNKFLRYHAIQGINLMLIGIAYCVVAGIINGIIWAIALSGCNNVGSILAGGCSYGNFGWASIVSFIVWIPMIILGILEIIGIVNAVNGKEKEVPILGKFKFIKQ